MPWYGEQEKRRINLLVARKMIAAAEVLRDRHRDDLGVGYPPASRPGEFPHRRTGRMQLSVTVTPSVPEQVVETRTVQVSYHPDVARYAATLKASGRLEIADTAARVRPEMAARFHQVTD
jgi:hypothetical protein